MADIADTATVLLQTADASAPNGQAMGALATGLVKNTTTTGVQTIAAVDVDYVTPNSTLLSVKNSSPAANELLYGDGSGDFATLSAPVIADTGLIWDGAALVWQKVPRFDYAYIMLSTPTDLPNSYQLTGSANISVNTSGDNVILDIDGAAAALNNIAGTGLVTKTGATTFVARDVVAANSTISVTNGDGVSGNPAIGVVNNTSTQRTIFSDGGTPVGTRQEFNLIAGSGITLTSADDAGNDRVNYTLEAVGADLATATVITSTDATSDFPNSLALDTLDSGILINDTATGVPSVLPNTAGSLYVGNGTTAVELAIGTPGQILTVNAAGTGLEYTADASHALWTRQDAAFTTNGQVIQLAGTTENYMVYITDDAAVTGTVAFDLPKPDATFQGQEVVIVIQALAGTGDITITVDSDPANDIIYGGNFTNSVTISTGGAGNKVLRAKCLAPVAPTDFDAWVIID